MTEPKDKSEVNNYASDFVDVRDVADAVVRCLNTGAAAGERFILDAGTLSTKLATHFTVNCGSQERIPSRTCVSLLQYTRYNLPQRLVSIQMMYSMRSQLCLVHMLGIPRHQSSISLVRFAIRRKRSTLWAYLSGA